MSPAEPFLFSFNLGDQSYVSTLSPEPSDLKQIVMQPGGRNWGQQGMTQVSEQISSHYGNPIRGATVLPTVTVLLFL